jgi:hypothetical protein
MLKQPKDDLLLTFASFLLNYGIRHAVPLSGWSLCDRGHNVTALLIPKVLTDCKSGAQRATRALPASHTNLRPVNPRNGGEQRPQALFSTLLSVR